MSQVVRRLEYFLPVVSIQVDATEHMQLRVDPVQPAFDQICEEDEAHKEAGEGEKRWEMRGRGFTEEIKELTINREKKSGKMTAGIKRWEGKNNYTI